MSKELFERALQEYGVKEIPGKQHAERIIQYLKWAGFDSFLKTDEDAWCSTFVNALCAVLCLERSHKANARSWLKVGEEVMEPQLGDVVVFWRNEPNGWEGHVALFACERDGQIYVLGGNQGNQVCIAPYPKSRLLGYRRLRPLN